LAGQFEIELGWLAVQRFGVVDRSLDLTPYEKNNFVIGERQIAHAVVSTRIGADNLLEPASVFGFDVHFSAGNGSASGIFNYALDPGRTSRRSGPCGDRRNKEGNE
jgi:hypothetical protein